MKSQKELLEEYGWVVHYVFETEKKEFDGLCNIHTHGVKENFDHPDLQIVLPIQQNIAHAVLHGVVEYIKEGKSFESDQRSYEVLQGMDVIFKEFKEGDRTVLRIMLPDPNGLLPGEDGCESMYERQLEELPD